MCPHSLIGSPDRCSQCAAYPNVRKVTLIDSRILIDAQPVGRNEDPMGRRRYGRAGGRRRRPRL